VHAEVEIVSGGVVEVAEFVNLLHQLISAGVNEEAWRCTKRQISLREDAEKLRVDFIELHACQIIFILFFLSVNTK